ncbi:MAG: hypothetical protein LBN95_06440 [Prevotellaceae bacterium]|jgi:hypothetical protein|nr:hypothetical protein [Prevotellaceae bacterium]
MEVIKSILITLQSLLLAALMQVRTTLAVLVLLFFVNILLGIVADVVINGNKFNFKKFMYACVEVGIYILIVCGIAVIAHIKGEIQLGDYALNALSWLFIYAYGTNIFKNLHKILPNSLVISYIYYVISFEIIKKIPFFNNFQKSETE